MPLTELEIQARALARERIAAGRLPCEAPSKTWGGYGSGKACDLCDEPITADQIEMELQVALGLRVLRMHRICYAAWHLECERADHLKKTAPR